jgi:hypothetical protein
MTTKPTLSRDAILGKTKLKTERVDVPEWGGAVLVRELTGAERDAFEASILDDQGNADRERMVNSRARLAVRSIVDENGERLFSDDDAEALGVTSGRALDRVFSVASRLSGITPDDLEELTKNSAGGRRAASGSRSPRTSE